MNAKLYDRVNPTDEDMRNYAHIRVYYPNGALGASFDVEGMAGNVGLILMKLKEQHFFKGDPLEVEI